ncbi:hypothetical protein AMATHDRAFT_146106 [Amanita thiersii Skay4041]|uniref:Nucleolar protein 16 n=1 Tax=Amanita thiersii Skay4041 TaxID=703135 RepID=A0A2A9NQM8_9AGAR|nr:hypothetical protein AMATHDRAFT_146106 [Amanita thiersii Skay4041]
MANPRQRRKTRSSSHKPVSLSRNAKRNLKRTPTIRGPKILQDAWDKRKTVKQNYAALGLAHSLGATVPGGVEPPVTARTTLDESMHLDSTDIHSASSSVPTTLGKIIRDETGNVIDIELPSDVNFPENIPGVKKDPEVDNDVMQKWVTKLGRCGIRPSTSETNVHNKIVQALEQISVPPNGNITMSMKVTGTGGRAVSAGEKKYLERLVDKYGVDVEGMARDRKLNAEQRTSGELRRALRRTGMANRGSVVVDVA